MLEIEPYLEAIKEGDDAAAEEAIENFHDLSPSQIASFLEILQTLLVDSDPNSRWWAVRGLAALDDPRVIEPLLSTLNDPDASVRQCGVLGLRYHPHPKAIPALIKCLEDEDQLTVRLAVISLSVIGEATVPPLIKVLQQGNPVARSAVARALALIGDARAIPTLFSLLDDDSALVELWAAEGLDRLGVGMIFFKP